MPESRYIKETKRYRNHGLNKHHRDGGPVEPIQPAKAVDTPKSRKRSRGVTPSPRQRTQSKGGFTITARLAIQLGVLSVAAGFYVNFFFEIFAIFAAVPAIWFLGFWGRLFQKVAPHRSVGSLAFESGLLLLILVWLVRVGSVTPAYTYPLIVFNPVELGYRLGDLWAVAPPFTMMAWILEFVLLPFVAPVRLYRARKPKSSNYDPFTR